jgi:Ca2+-binding EF-hand superfamily protein
MPRTPTISLALGLCVFLAVSLAPQIACADTAAAVVSKYDRDSDQTLDLSEVNTAASARFERNHDGTLSKDEYLALVQKFFRRADADHDGTLDAKELRSRAGQRLKRLID